MARIWQRAEVMFYLVIHLFVEFSRLQDCWMLLGAPVPRPCDIKITWIRSFSFIAIPRTYATEDIG